MSNPIFTVQVFDHEELLGFHVESDSHYALFPDKTVLLEKDYYKFSEEDILSGEWFPEEKFLYNLTCPISIGDCPKGIKDFFESLFKQPEEYLEMSGDNSAVYFPEENTWVFH